VAVGVRDQMGARPSRPPPLIAAGGDPGFAVMTAPDAKSDFGAIISVNIAVVQRNCSALDARDGVLAARPQGVPSDNAGIGLRQRRDHS
jgi:hypothetical protein